MDKAADYYREDKARMVAYVPPSVGSVIDIGCGAGGFGRALKAQRPEVEVWGVELVARAAAEAAEHLDRVVVGAFPEVGPELGRTFDCIVFNDVLEHLADPWAALASAHTMVGHDGTVVASVPNVRNWRTIIDLVRHGRWEHQEQGIHDVDHLRWFTRRTLIEAFTGTGWTVTTAEMVNETGFARARLFGTLLAPLTRDLRDEAGFKQIAVVATSGGTAG